MMNLMFLFLGDSSIGYYIQPTIIVTTNPHFKTLTEEIFGPVLTIYVYPSNDFKSTVSRRVSSLVSYKIISST